MVLFCGQSLDEHLCLTHAAQGLRVSIVRYFNAYGPRLDAQGYGSVIGTFVSQALANESLTVHADGWQTRCFTYVDDRVQGTVLAATRPEALGQVFNIGGVAKITVLDLAGLILGLSHSTAGVRLVPYGAAYGAGFEDTPRRVRDVSKAQHLLGFRALVPLEE